MKRVAEPGDDHATIAGMACGFPPQRFGRRDLSQELSKGPAVVEGGRALAVAFSVFQHGLDHLTIGKSSSTEARCPCGVLRGGKGKEECGAPRDHLHTPLSRRVNAWTGLPGEIWPEVCTIRARHAQHPCYPHYISCTLCSWRGNRHRQRVPSRDPASREKAEDHADSGRSGGSQRRRKVPSIGPGKQHPTGDRPVAGQLPRCRGQSGPPCGTGVVLLGGRLRRCGAGDFPDAGGATSGMRAPAGTFKAPRDSSECSKEEPQSWEAIVGEHTS